ncbi:MAG TPA: allantoicase [Kofleriaceae bacterium]|nr:allantoicase [Kofleriaceae bacterium]
MWDLPDLASESVGGAAILCNDEFFAEKENLVKPHAAVWKEHEYTDRGKWMDGWETRRYRPADGVAPGRDSDVHDWCIVRLGLPGVIKGVVVDTAFFRGNYPDSCALWGTTIDEPLDLRALSTATWTPLISRSPLEGNCPNKFVVTAPQRFTHVRLDIYPDGGVARLRLHGEVAPQLRKRGLVDLAALEHGAVVETCSDMFFGSRNNLIKPGPSRSMADGWETRRRRGPGNDWAIVRLASAGTIDQLEIDTSHFKGNAPSLCTVEGRVGDAWRMLLASPLQPHTRHVFENELRRVGDVSHLRLSVFPCGGVARLRAWGTPASPADGGIAKLNALSQADAVETFKRCCGSLTWAAAMAGARPFEDAAALLRIAEHTWWSTGVEDHLEAFAAHPKIGDRKTPATGDAKWSTGEQAGTTAANDQTLAELAEANRLYEAQLGFIFIVCASGRSADAMLADLRARLSNSREVELRTAAEEQAKITRLRLRKLLHELEGAP